MTKTDCIHCVVCEDSDLCRAFDTTQCSYYRTDEEIWADEKRKFAKEQYKDLKQLYYLMNDYFERVDIFSYKSDLERLALEISTRGMQIIGEIIDECEEIQKAGEKE